MSDDEEAYQYSDDDADNAPVADDSLVRVENAYYASKSNVASNDLDAADAGFKSVLELERVAAAGGGASLAEWGFKATKQLVKLAFRRHRFDAMLASYKELLARISDNTVTRNRAEKSINSILDLVSTYTPPSGAGIGAGGNGGGVDAMQVEAEGGGGGSASPTTSSSHLYSFFDATLEALVGKAGGSERLAFKTRTKLARLHLAAKDWPSMRTVLDALILSTTPTAAAAASTDLATARLEVLALQIQMYSELRDAKKLKVLVDQANAIRAAVPSPAVTGVIKESLAKMLSMEGSWDAARVEFHDAFVAFDEAGLYPRTIANLQYLLLSNMLSLKDINPFDDQSAKAYEKDPNIAEIVALMKQYTNVSRGGDLESFTRLLHSHATSASCDDFTRSHLTELLATIRAQKAISLVEPYSRVSLAYVAAELGVSYDDAEAIVARLLLDGRLAHDAAIDGVNRLLVLHGAAACAGGERTFKAPEGSAMGVVGGGAGAGGVSDGRPIPDRRYAELAALASKLSCLLNTVDTAGAGVVAAAIAPAPSGGHKPSRGMRHAGVDGPMAGLSSLLGVGPS